MFRRICINAGIMLVLVTFLGLVFCFGKRVKQRWIVYKTLHSSHWVERTAEIESARPGDYRIVFLGNSLTEMFDLNYFFEDTSILNCGIVGDFSEGLVKRSEAIVRLKPKKLFIEIGINDIIEQVPLEEICSNYELLLNKIKSGSPETEIFIQSNLPVIINRPSLWVGNEDVNKLVLKQNGNLKAIAEKYKVTFIDLYHPFIRSGAIKDLLIEDGIHLTYKAYGVWKLNVIPYLINE